MQGVAKAGAEVGISFNYAAVLRTPNTFDSHRLVWRLINTRCRTKLSSSCSLPILYRDSIVPAKRACRNRHPGRLTANRG